MKMHEEELGHLHNHFPAVATPLRWGVRFGGGAFTLIEMTLAMAILSIISLTVFQFTQTTLRAAELATTVSEQDLACGGLRRLFAAQLGALPANQSGALVGVNIDKKGGGRRDALQLVCPAGNALLTPDARGFYQVTLGIREMPRDSGHYALGMERQPWTDDDDDDDENGPGAAPQKAANLSAGQSKLPSDWVKLLDDVRSLEIAYFDARLNGWVDKWTDPGTLPNLVRLRLTLAGMKSPYEIIERVPGGGIVSVIPKQLLPTFGNGNGANVNGGGGSGGAGSGGAGSGKQIQTGTQTGGNPLYIKE